MILLHPAWLAAAAIALLLFLLTRRSAIRDDWSRVLSQDVMRLLKGAEPARRARDLTLLALAATFAALASPAVRAPAQSFVPAEGVVIVMDVSRSMTLGDIRPSRLSAARAAAAALAAEAGAKPVSLVVYAGDAFVAQPFSRDRSQLNSFIANIEHGLIEQEGSDLERAQGLVRSVLLQSGMTLSRIVLMSDGGGVSSGAIELAGQLHKTGARLDGILVASATAGTPDKPDIAGFSRLVGAGGGDVLSPDAYGAIDVGKFGISRRQGTENYFLLSTPVTDWRNLSHWLLLASAPLFLLLFRRGTT